MFRHRIEADENTQVDAIVADLKTRMDRANIDAASAAYAVAAVEQVLKQFISSGQKLTAIGSQFRGNREVDGPGYKISVAFAPKKAKSFWSRLLGR